MTLLLCVASGAWADTTYKSFTEETLYEFTADNVSAAQTAGWLGSGTTASSRDVTTNPFTGESISKTKFPGLNVKKGNSSKTCIVNISGTASIIFYCINHSSSGRYVKITATPTSGTALTEKGVEGSNPYSIELTLDPTLSYTIVADGTNDNNDGQDCTIFGIKCIPGVTKTVVSKTITGIKINGTSWDINGLTRIAVV